MDRPPPFTALRAFEAAARHLSFAEAAAELSVTPAALSFQIRSLEDHLEAKVFTRGNRSVALTEIGRALYPGIAEGLSMLTGAWTTARRRVTSNALTITAGPAFTAKWLAPRLFTFAQANPDLDLRFSATLRLLDFTRDEIDIAIRFGLDASDTVFHEVICDEWITPVMHPSLAETVHEMQDLLTIPLIHDDSLEFLKPQPDWTRWFNSVGLTPPDVHGARFSQADHAMDLALSGGGAWLGRGSLIERALREGRLVAPFQETLWVGAQYRLICPLGLDASPTIARFRSWVADELTYLHALTETRVFLNPPHEA